MTIDKRLEKKYTLPEVILSGITKPLEQLEAMKMSDDSIMEAVRGGLYYARWKGVKFEEGFSMYVITLKNPKK
jgi:hypothetical protein